MGEMVTSDFAKEHQHNALMDCSFLKCVLIIQRHMLLLSLKAELGAFKTCHNAELLCVKWSKWKLLWNEVRFSRLEVATRTRGHGANTAWLELDEGKISPLTSFWKIVISYTSSSTCHRAGTHLRCDTLTHRRHCPGFELVVRLHVPAAVVNDIKLLDVWTLIFKIHFNIAL